MVDVGFLLVVVFDGFDVDEVGIGVVIWFFVGIGFVLCGSYCV